MKSKGLEAIEVITVSKQSKRSKPLCEAIEACPTDPRYNIRVPTLDNPYTHPVLMDQQLTTSLSRLDFHRLTPLSNTRPLSTSSASSPPHSLA